VSIGKTARSQTYPETDLKPSQTLTWIFEHLKSHYLKLPQRHEFLRRFDFSEFKSILYGGTSMIEIFLDFSVFLRIEKSIENFTCLTHVKKIEEI
jgi:hypothetical protein